MKCAEASQAVGEVDNGERSGVERPAAMAAVAMSMAGAGLLGWWVWVFRPLHQQMWMVPASLIIEKGLGLCIKGEDYEVEVWKRLLKKIYGYMHNEKIITIAIKVKENKKLEKTSLQYTLKVSKWWENLCRHADFVFSYFVIEYYIKNKVQSRETDTIFYNGFNIKTGFLDPLRAPWIRYELLRSARPGYPNEKKLIPEGKEKENLDTPASPARAWPPVEDYVSIQIVPILGQTCHVREEEGGEDVENIPKIKNIAFVGQGRGSEDSVKAAIYVCKGRRQLGLCELNQRGRRRGSSRIGTRMPREGERRRGEMDLKQGLSRADRQASLRS
ncbi:hypothetical protein IEQ34_015155 [Dendrobium chrysotoxum]|uniref:Uncharacterized protein n=1 Tax=Dendrobium chrysotoxum TaxID=161865 RepID=A0AAV7GNZ4_DENCH|nr:hypothetical protein IEQ34_015155 [Dendrobium chrysotoxum]